MKKRIFIDGEAGTTGMKLAERVRSSGDFELLTLSSSERKNVSVRTDALNSCDIAVLCLPDDAARQAVSLVSNPEVKLLDASVAHRVSQGWCYGLPELTEGQTDRIASAMRVTNPGCFATGAIALIRPLIDAGVLHRDARLTMNGVSGYTGGGRPLIDAFEGVGPEVIESNHYIYALDLHHKHIPEMALHGGLAHSPIFVPSVGRYRQGMLVQLPLFLESLSFGKDEDTVTQIFNVFKDHYAGCADIAVYGESAHTRIDPEALNDTNRLEIFILSDSASDRVVLVARLDNLGKGSSGAAMQNLRLMAYA